MTEGEKKERIVEIEGAKTIKPTDSKSNKDQEEEQNIDDISQENSNNSNNLPSKDNNEEEEQEEQDEKEEKEEKEEREEKDEKNDITNVEYNEPKKLVDAETQKDDNIIDQEEKNQEIKENNEVKDGNTQNLDITNNNLNNNLSNILSNNNLNNLDIANLVKSQSYLTSLPISITHKSNKQIQLNGENKKTYNNLKDKENSICMEINAIKKKRNLLKNYSYSKLEDKNIIENNIRETELKKLKKNEINLMEKLETIKLQINDLLNNEKKLNRNNNIKEYLEKLKINEANNEMVAKAKMLEAEKSRQKHLQDLERSKNKKIELLNKMEEEEKNKKIQFLKDQREKEIELMRKRKKEIDEKIEKTKKSIQNKPNFDPKSYLYNKLATQFEENEKKYLFQQKMDRKLKLSGPEEIQVVKRRIIESKYELEKRKIEKTNEMHQLWHSRSLIMPKYQSNALKKLNEIEAKQAEDEEKEKIKKIVLVKEKEKYGKENIPLPPISEKLKDERQKRQISFLNFEGKERVKLLKEELSNNKCKIKNFAVEEQIFKQNIRLQKYRQRSAKSQDKQRNKNRKMINSASAENINSKDNENDIVIKNIEGKKLSPKKLKMRRPNEINYLEELKKERKTENKSHNINWNKAIQNSNNGKGGDLETIKRQIEILDEKYQREKDLMKVKGGYLLNQDLGDDINNMIINSIKGKLALIENLNN